MSNGILSKCLDIGTSSTKHLFCGGKIIRKIEWYSKVLLKSKNVSVISFMVFELRVS